VTDDRFRLDRARLRRRFAGAADRYPAADVLDREVARRMAERLDLVKLAPREVLDLGCGLGPDLAELAQRYPAARVVGADFALPMLAAVRAREGWLARALREAGRLAGLLGVRAAGSTLVCADAERLPFAAGRFQLLWSNLMLHWCDDPQAVFREAHRVLETDGLFSFTALGPDTLRELRAASREAGIGVRAHRFIDMHDLGDMLVGVGFAEPVMDMERITLTYEQLDRLVTDLRHTAAMAAGNARPRGLMTPRAWARLAAAYDKLRRADLDGRLPATFEIIYGHAWKAEARTTEDGRAIVRFDPSARRTG